MEHGVENNYNYNYAFIAECLCVQNVEIAALCILLSYAYKRVVK